MFSARFFTKIQPTTTYSLSVSQLIILAALATITSSVNNQEPKATKNPMEQARLEFQKLRSKKNLVAASLTNKINITANNSPALYQIIAAACQSLDQAMPTIYVVDKESPRRYKFEPINYNVATNELSLGKTLLNKSAAELKTIIEYSIRAEIRSFNEQKRYHICTAVAQNLILAIPAFIISALFMTAGFCLIAVPTILLTAVIMSNIEAEYTKPKHSRLLSELAYLT